MANPASKGAAATAIIAGAVYLIDCTVTATAGVSSTGETETGVREKENNPLEKGGNETSANSKRLCDSISFFPDKRLAQSSNSKSVVYAGVTTHVSREIRLAIKMIQTPTDKNRREAGILDNLAEKPHPNVVSIKHTGVCTQGAMEYLYIAMYRCSTVNLASYIKDRKAKNIPFNLRQAVDFSDQIVEGLSHIHKLNILHRDLKPSSVLFSECGEFLTVCDFGISKQLKNGRSKTKVSTLVATVDAYRAPETYQRDEITKEADIFSLGLVLHYLWSYGFHAFGLEPTLWECNIKFGKNLDLSHLRSPFRDVARNLLTKMLRIRPKDRPNVKEVKSDAIFNFESLREALLQNLDEIWTGTVKDKTGGMELTCTLYRSKGLFLANFGSDWSFEMKSFPHFDTASIKKVADEEPSGYFVASSTEQVQGLTKQLINNNQFDVAWIDVSREAMGKRVEFKAFVLVYHKGNTANFERVS